MKNLHNCIFTQTKYVKYNENLNVEYYAYKFTFLRIKIKNSKKVSKKFIKQTFKLEIRDTSVTYSDSIFCVTMYFLSNKFLVVLMC